ncbi:hypothetical protein [Lacipirellula limnantheis]|uniref:Uncharacterized protein n=1 Tax=Lacipirellula limnantheis TaxID=2528024 RepID=A0A517TVS3_9BACT|nr:hypothetical protein [Lacipirellula limnantheis]QDT72467.1 hypothetical protein I41_16450 [Lacipirellula limnantheis]
MLAYLRYALTSAFFAASVGCLALWWKNDRFIFCDYVGTTHQFGIRAEAGFADVYLLTLDNSPRNRGWFVNAGPIFSPPWFSYGLSVQGNFGSDADGVYFPLWYPALVFALAGVACLRLGRRFTLRSAIIATTVVAGLLGMAVGL